MLNDRWIILLTLACWFIACVISDRLARPVARRLNRREARPSPLAWGRAFLQDADAWGRETREWLEAEDA